MKCLAQPQVLFLHAASDETQLSSMAVDIPRFFSGVE